MGHLGSLSVLVLFLGLAMVEASGHGPAGVKPVRAEPCKIKRSPCYNFEPRCPATCPTLCHVDCTTCEPVCGAAPAPPTFVKPQRAKKCTNRRSSCFNGEPFCPQACPTTCYLDCNSCKPVCGDPPAPKTAKCKNKKYPSCYFTEHTCPDSCSSSCQVDCVTCRPVCHCDRPGAVCQDPKFIGADGLTFYFHGKKEQDFCLVTDSNLHINGHFIGKRNDKMKRDFTWVQSLGILFDSHKLYIGARKTATWNDAIDRLELVLDGKPITLPELQGASWSSSSAGLTITRTQNTNGVVIEVVGNFKIKAEVVPITEKESVIHNYGITSDDSFAHLDLGFKFYSLSEAVNGVLGQTYAPSYVSRVKVDAAMPVLGGNKEFSSSSIFSTDCSVAKFSGMPIGGSDHPNLDCAAGFSGAGVVCKR